jgi:hypothetical protein
MREMETQIATERPMTEISAELIPHKYWSTSLFLCVLCEIDFVYFVVKLT